MRPSVSIVPLDNTAISYGRSYRVGDVGRVDVGPGKTIVDVIRLATITVRPGEDFVVKPVIGNAQATDPSIPDFFKRNKALADRVFSLETS